MPELILWGFLGAQGTALTVAGGSGVEKVKGREAGAEDLRGGRVPQRGAEGQPQVLQGTSPCPSYMGLGTAGHTCFQGAMVLRPVENSCPLICLSCNFYEDCGHFCLFQHWISNTSNASETQLKGVKYISVNKQKSMHA